MAERNFWRRKYDTYTGGNTLRTNIIQESIPYFQNYEDDLVRPLLGCRNKDSDLMIVETEEYDS